MSMVLNCEQDLYAYFGNGEIFIFDCMFWRFVFGSYPVLSGWNFLSKRVSWFGYLGLMAYQPMYVN